MALLLFGIHAFVMGHAQQHWTKGKSLALDSSCVHLGLQQSLRARFPIETKGTHTQSNVKHRGGRELKSKKMGRRRQSTFHYGELWCGTLERAVFNSMTLRTTTHIPPRSSEGRKKKKKKGPSLFPSKPRFHVI